MASLVCAATDSGREAMVALSCSVVETFSGKYNARERSKSDGGTFPPILKSSHWNNCDLRRISLTVYYVEKK
jgi:hypothetical protein